MSDPVWLPDVLRAAGLQCDIYPGAFDRGHGDFGRIWGVVAHHTGSFGETPGGIANHPELGLCSQLFLSRDGVFTLCGVGIAWHAGAGAWPGIARDNANAVTIGIEAANDGTGWSPAQYRSYTVGVAAILRRLGHDSSRVIGHREWYHGRRISTADARRAGGKWDPGGIDMDVFRRDVQAQLDQWNNPEEEDDMAFTDDDRRKLNEVYNQVRKGWSQLGSNAQGQPLTLVDGLAKALTEIAAVKGILTTLSGVVGKIASKLGA